MAGDGPHGAPYMKFTLTYEGELRSNDDYRRKWDIRKHFHPQLQELWRISAPLQSIEKIARVPKEGYFIIETHHSVQDANFQRPEEGPETIELLAPIASGGRYFKPLIRNTLALHCGLKILFLRKENPGRIYQGGDLDNRLKTLFDALSVPNDSQIVNDPTIEDPIFCLLEDDALIKSIDVDTQRLLTRPNASQHEVHLVIEIDVRVTEAHMYNQPFLGD